MADRAIEILNIFLKIFNRESGEYLKLIGDSTRTTPAFVGEVKINDINTGAVSNIMEYTRRLSTFLIDQLNLNNAVREFLDNYGITYYDTIRNAGESDADYADRIVRKIFALKQTPVLIQQALLPFADQVDIVEGIEDGAFSEISFTDNYRDFFLPGESIIKAAIAGLEGGMLFFFRVFMYNVDPADYKKIIQIIEDYRAAGIAYDVVVINP